MLPKRSTLISGSASCWKNAGLGGWPVSSRGVLKVAAAAAASVLALPAWSAGVPASVAPWVADEPPAARLVRLSAGRIPLTAPPEGARARTARTRPAANAIANTKRRLRRGNVVMIARSCFLHERRASAAFSRREREGAPGGLSSRPPRSRLNVEADNEGFPSLLSGRDTH